MRNTCTLDTEACRAQAPPPNSSCTATADSAGYLCFCGDGLDEADRTDHDLKAPAACRNPKGHRTIPCERARPDTRKSSRRDIQQRRDDVEYDKVLWEDGIRPPIPQNGVRIGKALDHKGRPRHRVQDPEKVVESLCDLDRSFQTVVRGGQDNARQNEDEGARCSTRKLKIWNGRVQARDSSHLRRADDGEGQVEKAGEHDQGGADSDAFFVLDVVLRCPLGVP